MVNRYMPVMAFAVLVVAVVTPVAIIIELTLRAITRAVRLPAPTSKEPFK